MYAVIQTGGKQYRVEEGQRLAVERLGGDEVSLRPVLVVDGDTVLATATQLAAAAVTARVVGETKGPKINGFTYKDKTIVLTSQPLVSVAGRLVSLPAPPARVVCAELPGGGGGVRGWAGPWGSDVRWWDPSAHRRCARWQVVVDCGADGGDVACVVVVEAGRAGVEAICD